MGRRRGKSHRNGGKGKRNKRKSNQRRQSQSRSSSIPNVSLNWESEEGGHTRHERKRFKSTNQRSYDQTSNGEKTDDHEQEFNEWGSHCEIDYPFCEFVDPPASCWEKDHNEMIQDILDSSPTFNHDGNRKAVFCNPFSKQEYFYAIWDGNVHQRGTTSRSVYVIVINFFDFPTACHHICSCEAGDKFILKGQTLRDFEDVMRRNAIALPWES